MAKTQYYTAATLDGYIADENNSLEWLFAVDRNEGEDHSFGRFFSDVGAMAMGATTYEWVLDHDGLLDHPDKWHAYYEETPCWVFSHRNLPPVPGADIQFVEGDVVPVHRSWRERRAKGTSGSSAAATSWGSSPTVDCWTRFSSASHR